MCHDGWYYLATTTGGDVRLRKARTLGDLKTAPDRVVWKEEDASRNRDLWAPEFHRLDAGEALGAGRLGEMLNALGLESLLAAGDAGDGVDAEAERLLRERQEARAARDFERADAIRDELAALGWQVRDAADGARLVRTS